MNQKIHLNHLKKKYHEKENNQNNDNDVPNTEFVEEKDRKQQDLTNDEMDQIRQQLEMMNKSNNIVASNS